MSVSLFVVLSSPRRKGAARLPSNHFPIIINQRLEGISWWFMYTKQLVSARAQTGIYAEFSLGRTSWTQGGISRLVGVFCVAGQVRRKGFDFPPYPTYTPAPPWSGTKLGRWCVRKKFPTFFGSLTCEYERDAQAAMCR